MTLQQVDKRHFVLVTGGREYTGRQSVLEVMTFLRSFYGSSLRVMHGDARGLDRLVAEVCDELGIIAKGYPADWKKNPRSAGHIRNGEMVARLVAWQGLGHTAQCVAWPGGNGTEGCVKAAQKAGIGVDLMPESPETLESAPILNDSPR